MRVFVAEPELAKLRDHYRDKDPAEAVAALHRQGLSPADIAFVIDRSLRTAYRLIKETGGKSKAERRAALEGLPDLGDMPELSEEDRELILSHSPEGLLRFAELFSHLVPGDLAGPLPPHTWDWVADFYREPMLMLNVPPGHYKSATFSVLIPTYEIICNRAIRVILISQSSELAVQWVRNIASVLREDAIVRAFGRFAPDFKGQAQWQEGVGILRVQGGSEFTVLARGAKTAILGRRCDLLITDDPSDVDTASSDTETNRLFGRWQAEALTRGRAAAKVVVIGQRLGPRDFFQRVEDLEDEQSGNPLFTVIKTPAVIRWPDKDEKGKYIAGTAEVLDPEHWPWEALLAKLNALGSARFSTMFQQLPVSLGGGLMATETFKMALDPNLKAGVGRRGVAARAVEAEGKGRVNPYVRTLSIDPSPTQFYGLIVADVMVKPDGLVDIWVLDIQRFKARSEGSAEHFLRTVGSLVSKYRVTNVVCEESSFFKYVKESSWWSVIFDRPGGPKYIKQITGTNKHHAEFGVESLAADFEGGRIHLPAGDEAGRAMIALLQGEVESYEQSTRATSDLIMALWFIKNQAKRLKVKKPHTGVIPGDPRTGLNNRGRPAGAPNAIGRKMLAARYQQKELSREAWEKRDLKEAQAARAADQLVNDYAAREREEEEAYA